VPALLKPDTAKEGRVSAPATRTLRGLDWLNFFLADVQTGVGPFLAIYLEGYRWNEQRVGIALTIGGIAGILSQAQRRTPQPPPGRRPAVISVSGDEAVPRNRFYYFAGV
jgi:hypothetical protein